MTPKQKTQPRAEDEVAEVAAEPESVSLDGLSASSALLLLRALRKTGDTVVVTATLGEPQDRVVVDGHAFTGQQVGAAWRFDPRGLNMACRVAGWTKVVRDGEQWRLS